MLLRFGEVQQLGRVIQGFNSLELHSYINITYTDINII